MIAFELVPRDVAFMGLRDEHLPVGPRHLLLYGLKLGIVDRACASVCESTSVSWIVQNLDAAVRQGIGITTLPCFVGDADPLLVRVPDTDLHLYGTVWLLTQGFSRNSYQEGSPRTLRVAGLPISHA